MSTLQAVSEDGPLQLSNNSEDQSWQNADAVLLYTSGKMPQDQTLDVSIRARYNQLCARDIELGAKLGEGAFATTYVATLLKELKNSKMGTFVCVKILRDGSTEDQAYHEVINLRRVQCLGEHENVVKVLGSNLTITPYFIVMEHVDGWSLKEEIASKGPVGFPMVQRWTIHILRALRHLHESNLLHRDLKSGNVMLQVKFESPAQPSPDGEDAPQTCPLIKRSSCRYEGCKPVAKIVDFGETKNITLLTPLTKEVGTWKWMPPEVMGVDSEGSVTGGAKYGTSADVYSLGMVIFEMLSANDPFAGLSTMQAAFAVSTGKRPSFKNHKTKAILEFMIRSCWRTDPDSRPILQELFFLAKLVNTEYCAEWLPAEYAVLNPEASVYDALIPQCPLDCATAEVLKQTKYVDFLALREEHENGKQEEQDRARKSFEPVTREPFKAGISVEEVCPPAPADNDVKTATDNMEACKKGSDDGKEGKGGQRKGNHDGKEGKGGGGFIGKVFGKLLRSGRKPTSLPPSEDLRKP